MKYKINKNSFYLLAFLSFAVIAYFLKDDFGGILSQLSKVKLIDIALAGMMMIIYWLLETAAYQKLLNFTQNTLSFFDLFKTTMATQFFNGITPFSSGGQPFQIYIICKLSKSKVGRITSSALQNFIVYQLALVIYGLIALLSQYLLPFVHIEITKKVSVVIFLGFTLNLIVIVALIVLGSSKKVGFAIVKSFIYLLNKIKIVKNKEKSWEKMQKTLNEFHAEITTLSSNKSLLLVTLLLNLAKLTAYYSVAYFISIAIGIENISIIDAILASAYTMLITSIIPLPGASGGAEFGFLIFFSSVISGQKATAIMLLWRFITYYIGLILGFLVFTFGFKKTNRAIRKRRNRKRLMRKD